MDSLYDVLPHSLHTKFGPIVPNVFIPAAALVSIAFAILLWARVSRVKVAGAGGQSGENGRQYLLEEEQRGEDEVRILSYILCLGVMACSCPYHCQDCRLPALACSPTLMQV